MSPLVQSLLATGLVSAISLVGIVFVFAGRRLQQLEMLFLSFAAGVLLGTTFLQLLPEAMVQASNNGAMLSTVLLALVGSFVLERVLHWFHEPGESHASSSRYLILVGDGLHNFVDGMVIAASFLVDTQIGVTTTMSIAAHEISQEIADYGILVSGGFSPGVALTLNFLSGLTAIAGSLVCFSIGGFVESHIAWVVAATAGMFLYIAVANLLPELNHPRYRRSWMATVPFFVGLALTAIVTSLAPR